MEDAWNDLFTQLGINLIEDTVVSSVFTKEIYLI